MRQERHLSRQLTVEYPDGRRLEYHLSIATVTIDEEGLVAAVDVAPFEREEEGVTYHDRPLLIRIGSRRP